VSDAERLRPTARSDAPATLEQRFAAGDQAALREAYDRHGSAV
jgi:hypothetical protein